MNWQYQEVKSFLKRESYYSLIAQKLITWVSSVDMERLKAIKLLRIADKYEDLYRDQRRDSNPFDAEDVLWLYILEKG